MKPLKIANPTVSCRRKVLLGALLCAVMFVVSSLTARAASESRIYAGLMPLGSQELLDMGDRCGGDELHPNDTVMICYAIVCNRYAKGQTREEKQQSLEACLRLYKMYFYVYYDYPKCFEYLSRAKEIADDLGRPDPRVFLLFGAMYQTVSEETHSKALDAKAMHYYEQAFNVAWQQNDDRHMDMAVTNLAYVAHDIDSLSAVSPLWKKYSRRKNHGMLWQYNNLLFQALTAFRQHRFAETMSCYDKQLALIPREADYDRLLYFTLVNKSRLLAQTGDLQAAVVTAKNAEFIAEKRQQKDLKLEVYSVLSDFYKRQGDAALYNVYRDRYYLMRDTLMNYQQLASVNEMEFQSELKQMGEEMAALEHKRAVQGMVTLVVGIVSVLVLALLFVIYRQNRHLKRSNSQLYRQNVEMLAAEEEQRLLRKQVVEASEKPADEGENVKYKNSNLDEIAKNKLLESIRTVMENVDETCSPGFSVERLATLVDSKYKYVSQVIHEKYGCNFNHLLNQYRIKEACKRMNDLEHYGNLTIEAISNGVGFRSRSTFVSSFKRFTGLTPSEYQAMAREAQA